MSSISKLSIQGIRSFDNTERETITFNKPLTLIVGQNGSGKTTIIECLRYATTGDLPPHSKGGAFIHDPKICGEKEVLGQVKLAFTNVNGIQMICTRTMQVLVKKNTRQFKTLEGQLMASNNGERTTVSTRCAELDAQMPLYLGVSKSILDYVIFCHQEESLWPLSEPAVLKKRFDEIFEALKFTKALDSIKSLRKEKNVEIKLQTQTTEYLKADKDRADKAAEKANLLLERIEDYKSQADELETKMEMVTKQSDELFQSNQQFQQVLAEVQQLKRDRVVVGEQRERLEKNCTEVLTVSDDELQKQVSEFDSRLDDRRETVSGLKQDSEDARKDMEGHRLEYNSAIVEVGQWEAKKQELENQINARESLLEEIGKKWNTSDLNELRSDLKSDLERVKKEAEAEEGNQTDKISKLSTALTEKKGQINHDKASTLSYENEVRRLQDEMDTIPTVEGTIAYEESVIQKLEEKLAGLQGNSQGEEARFETEIESCDEQTEVLSKRLEKCNSDLAEFNSKSEKRAEHRMLVSELAKQRGVLRGVEDALSKQYGEVGVTDEKTYTAKLSSYQNAVEKGQGAVSKSRDSLANLTTRLDILNKESLVKDATLSELYETISAVLGEGEDNIDDYESTLENLSNDLEVATQNRESTMFTARYYETAVKLAKSAQHNCLLCSRKFSDTELTDFLAHVEEKTISLPDTKERADKEYQDIKSDFDNVQGISGEVREWRNLKESVESVSAQLKKLKQEVVEGQSAFEKEEESLSLLESQLRDLEVLKKAVEDVKRLKSDVASKEKELTDFEGEYSTLMDFSEESTSDLPSLASSLNSQIKSINQKRQKLVDDREALRKQFSSLQGQISDKKLSLSTQKNQLTKKTGLQQQISGLKTKIEECRARIRTVREEIESIEPKLQSLKNELSEMRVTNGDKMEAISDKLEDVKNDANQLSHMSQQIQQLEELDIASMLTKTGRRADSAKGEVENLTQRITQLGEDIATQEKALIDLKGHQRNLQDNLEVRRLTNEMSQIEGRIRELDETKAVRDRDEYQQKSQQLRSQHSAYSSKHAGLLGEMRQMDDQLRNLNVELKSEFLDVHEKYRKALILLKTTTVANEDLGKYGKALDSAIMQYHSMKMNEINTIIDELWKATYSGTDIDTILIRSDEDKPGAAKNRSYNYRVVMVKSDAELDMRGRCSAGQKVLAAIIIRLALAECFGINCGMIALDEPTTNLDSDNIESLAKGLSNIIDARSSQKNFQLIVITHDEKFLTHMAASKHTDHFYRVSRNVRQKSSIEWCPISLIQDS
ncbi:Subunit of MRX complex with Mre11p and Xrs2p, putative [Yarrowia lipolytica]|nr:Subunit of MRX complex with Mre11p and Xrs2p, putative [Yarrowia lipolytica]